VTQGQSAYTKDKERAIGSALSIGMRIVRSHPKLSQYRYWHIDVCAGSGWNEQVGVPGSPRVFLDIAKSIDLENFEAWFIERDRSAAESLVRSIGPDKRCFVINGDNRDVLKMFSKRIAQFDRPKYAIGSVLIDPNGWLYRGRDGNGFDPLELSDFLSTHRRIDVVMNLNVRTFRMLRKNEALGHRVMDLPAVSDMPALFNKEHWLLSDVGSYGGNSWVRLIGRNMATGDNRAMGHYHMNSEKGTEIVNAIEVRELRGVSAPGSVSAVPERCDGGVQLPMF